MNGGSALNYLLLGFVNILWIPTAMKIGRRPVLLLTTLICTAAGIWTANFTGTAQWMLSCVLNGVGTSAYQAVIQLCVFDMFFVHERGRGLSYYLFGQQLGSILGLITGGSIADGPGWRWSQWIVAVIDAAVLVLLVVSFEETMFPRFLFARHSAAAVSGSSDGPVEGDGSQYKADPDRKDASVVAEQQPASGVDTEAGDTLPDFPKRTAVQKLKLWTYCPQDTTTWWQYFRRPFFLFGFPNVVIVRCCPFTNGENHITDTSQSGFIFAFGCTAGIVSFNTSTSSPSLPLASPHTNTSSPSPSLRNPHLTPLQLEHDINRPRLPRRAGRQWRGVGDRRAVQRRAGTPPSTAQRRRQGAGDAAVGAVRERRVRRGGLLPVRVGRAGGGALADDRVWRGRHDRAPGQRVRGCDGVCDGLFSGGMLLVLLPFSRGAPFFSSASCLSSFKLIRFPSLASGYDIRLQ